MRIDYYPVRNFSWVAAAVGVGTAIYSGVRAAKQKKEAKKLEDQNRFPGQDTPDAVKEAEQLAQNAANTGLPGASMQMAQRGIDRNTATALGAAKSRGSGLAAIPYIQQQANDANLNLSAADANMRAQKQAQLINQKNAVGAYQQNAWDWNKKQRYIQNAAAVRALLGASRENMNNAIDRGLGAATSVAGSFVQGNQNWGGYGEGGAPMYSNGYGPNDNYSEFQSEYQ